ncbi:carbohydrate-binding module family 18 protein, partial [Cucurbitaria berberidis CBS 394.84]
ASQPVSTKARCGPSFGGQTCLGSRWGNCCSQYSYCGSTIDYCAVDTCQKGYGTCNG